MDEATTQGGATSRDQSRQDTTGPDYDFSLNIEEVAERYAAAGHARTLRSIQRYCLKGDLDCRKVPTATGEVYRVAPYSISRHIAQTNEIIAATGSATGRDMSRQDATASAPENRDGSTTLASGSAAEPERQDATDGDMSRLVAAGDREVRPQAPDLNNRYIEQLEKRIEEKDGQIGFLQDELKDRRDQFRGMKDIISEQKVLLQSMNSHMAPIFEALASAIENGGIKSPEIAPTRIHQQPAIEAPENA